MNRTTEIYRKRLEQGLCTRCGKVKVLPGQRMCPSCAERKRTLGRQLYRRTHPCNGNGRRGRTPYRYMVSLWDDLFMIGTEAEIMEKFECSKSAVRSWIKAGTFYKIFRIKKAEGSHG